MTSITVFAPVTVGNVAVGFDVLGHAIDGPGDRVTATVTDKPGVVIDEITGVATQLPMEPEKNTAGIGLLRMLVDTGTRRGLSLRIQKGIPLGSGMGGSAASAVAAVVAADAALDLRLDPMALIDYALDGEALTSQFRNADNVAPCLLGGLVLSTIGQDLRCVSIPVPQGLTAVVVHPDMRIETSSARKILAGTVELRKHTAQSAAHALLIAACYENDLDLVRRCLDDMIIEPQRKNLVPGFDDAKAVAVDFGALGCSLSGSGPAMFAWCRAEDGTRIAAAMSEVFKKIGADCDAWVSPVNAKGARIVTD